MGWWLLLAISVLIAWFVWWGVQRFTAQRQQRKLHRWVQQELDRLEAEYKTATNTNKLLQDLSVLVRRVAMSTFPREDVAGLYGETWASWLRASNVGTGLNEQSIRLLVDGPYKKYTASDVIPLLSACRQWVESVLNKGVTA